MDSLKQYFEVQRKDNEVLKEEIITKLETLFSPLDTPPSSSNRSPTKYCNYITDLCHFEQKVYHKLTEINFELKKFILQNKLPEVEAPPIKKENLDKSLDDIETLKANSSKLILKLDKLCNEQFQEAETNLILKSEFYDDAKICSKTTSDVFFQREGPLICLEQSSTTEIGENSIPEMKFFDLEENVDDGALTNEDDSNTRKHCDQISPQLYKGSDFYIPKTQDSDKFKGEFSQYETCEESFNFKSKTVEKNGKISMVESINFKSSDFNRAGQDNKSNTPSFENNDSLSDVILKNLMELTMTTSSNTNHCPDFNIDNNLNQNDEQTLGDTCEIRTEPTDKFRSMLRPDSDISSYYDSESETESNPAEQLLEDILKCDPETSLNMSDTNKEDYLKGLKEKKERTVSPIEENKENVEVTNNLPASSMSDSNEEQDTKNDCLNNELVDSSDNSNVDQIPVEKKEESTKTVFSAEEKIKKLGLQDRWTIFEGTRKMAVLPDLRLRSSGPPVTDSEKLKDIQNRNNKFEIADNVAPRLNTCCVFSHVESPSEFYIHPDTEESKLIDSLNDLITEMYGKTKSPFVSKYEAFENIGRYCCAYVKEDKMFYRAEIVDWLFDKAEKLVLIKLVDYGNSVYAHFKNLRMLTQQLCLLPKLAIKCYLPLLYPLGSTKFEILTEWSAESTEAFFELTGLSVENNHALFRIVYVEEERDGVGIDLYQVNGRDKNTIGQLLIDLGHAVQIVLQEDDPTGILSDEEDIKNLEKCDNINEVILGYDPKDEARICKFTKPDGGRCFKKRCKLEHTKFTRGGFTTDQTLTYAEALSDLNLPKPNDLIAIRFTTFVNATCFYANIVRNVANLRELEYIMNNPVNFSTFERFKILPAHGEVVLVKHWQKRWLRGKVRHHLYSEKGNCTGVQVFMVDYGDVIDVALDNIRQIKAEYLNLPFQAIECSLQNYEDSGEFELKDIDRFFYENMFFRNFTARVLAVSDMHICAEIYYRTRNLGDILVEYGFLKKVNNKILFPHPKSIIIPG